MRVRSSALSLLLVCSAGNAGTARPLTSEEEASALQHYRVNRADAARVVGYWYGNGRASAEIFSKPFETEKGSCVSRKFEADGEVSPDEEIVWTTPPIPSLIKQIVWLPEERQHAPCAEMLDSTVVSVATPIEEGTLQRIYGRRLELALSANESLGGKQAWPRQEVIGGRITNISVSEFSPPGYGSSGAYELHWMISECKGIHIAVETTGRPIELHVVNASRIMC